MRQEDEVRGAEGEEGRQQEGHGAAEDRGEDNVFVQQTPTLLRSSSSILKRIRN